MSERGSLVTEYIYCSSCFTSAKKVLLSKDKSLCTDTCSSWVPDGEDLPIIAGKLAGSYQGEELVFFETHLAVELAKVICCPLRVAVLAERGHQIFTVQPVEPKALRGEGYV